MKKELVVYYTWSNGNTEGIAKQLQAALGADIARIDTVKPYAGDYNEVVEQGRLETERGYKPEIRPLGVNLSDYDVIAVGTPTWWYTMAPAVLTFLGQNDFSGKTVVPFMTNGGWPGHVIKDMENACSGAETACPMQVQFDTNGGDELITPQSKIDKWTGDVKKLCSK